MSSIATLFISYAPVLFTATLTTIGVWISSYLISLCIGITVGTLCCRRLQKPFITPALKVMVKLLQGIPLYTQLLISYFVIPQLCGCSLSAYTTGIITLGICSGAYTAEIIRATMNALSVEQWETAEVLGYSTFAQLRYIILPQTLRYALPALATESNAVIKSTSLLASLGVVELTKVGLNIVAAAIDPIGIFSAIALIYLALSISTTYVWHYAERKLAW